MVLDLRESECSYEETASGPAPRGPSGATLIDRPLWSGMRNVGCTRTFTGIAKKLPARRIGQTEGIACAALFITINLAATITIDGRASV